MKKLWIAAVFFTLLNRELLAQKQKVKYCLVTIQFNHIGFTKYGYRIEDISIDSTTVLDKKDNDTLTHDLIILKNKNSTATVFNYMVQGGWEYVGSTQLAIFLIQYHFKKEEW